MKLCMPSVGSMMMLTEDWKLNLDEIEITTYMDSKGVLNHGFDCLDQKFKTKTVTRTHPYSYGNSSKQTYDVTSLTGELILPKGTLLKITDITFWSVREKQSKNYRKDLIQFTILETPLKFKVDNEVVKTPTGRISKKKKDRPEISFYVTPEAAATCEFEFSI